MKKNNADIAIGLEYRRFISDGLLALYSSNPYKGSYGGAYKAINSNNVYLGKWLIRAQKMKLYKKELAQNIAMMIKLYKTQGPKADLVGVFEKHYVENITTDLCNLEFEASEHDRIILAMAALKEMSWVVNFPLNYDPSLNGPYQPLAEKEAFSLAMDWSNSINEDGTMANPLRIYSTEVLQELVDVFYEYGFFVYVTNKSESDDRFDKPKWYYCLDIYPHDEPTNGIAIPSVCMR